MMSEEAVVAEAATATMTVVEADTVVAIEDLAATTITTVDHHLDTTIATTAPTDVAMTTGLVALIAMPQVAAAMIATAAVEMIAAVVEATIVATIVPTAVAVAPATVTHRLLEMPMEVDPPMIVSTIGTPVARLRSAKLNRCGALCQIKAPKPSGTQETDFRQCCWFSRARALWKVSSPSDATPYSLRMTLDGAPVVLSKVSTFSSSHLFCGFARVRRFSKSAV